jgi:hypothetical protein
MARGAYDDDEQDGQVEVEALHRFLTDPVAQKTLFAFVSAYYNSLEDDDEEMDAADHPEMSRNDRVLALTGIFELLEDLLGGLSDEDEEEDDGDDEIANIIKTQKRRKELAKDKRMSAFYKSFMGDMRDLVNPWHKDREKFLSMWRALGEKIAEKSPANKKSIETSATIGSEAALPGKVMRSLTEMGFVPVSQPKSGDAAWAKRGTPDGFPDRQVYLIRREEGSYLILLSKDSKYDTYGKPLRQVQLDEGASDSKILTVLGMMYDALVME